MDLTNYCTGKDYAEKENLKEMGDVSSGMASTIIQIFLKVGSDTCRRVLVLCPGELPLAKTIMQIFLR
jgi:hypothetical protein